MNIFNTVNSAIFQYVKTPFFALVAIFAIVVVLTVVFAVREIKNDTK